jgi:hypothetical protein
MEDMIKPKTVERGGGIWGRYKADISLAVLGAFVLSPFAAYSMHAATDIYRDHICGANRYLSEGLALRKAAAKLTIDSSKLGAINSELAKKISDIHSKANEKLEAAANCGNPKAIAQMGHAYCFGFGMDHPNPARGRAMAQDAVRGDPGLVEWVLSSDYCP